MARQRITRKDLKQPDQFITTTGHVLDWIKAHTRHVLCGILGVVVVVGLIVAWVSWQRQREQHAAALLQQAITLNETASGADTVNRPVAIEKLKELTQRYGGTSAGAHAYLRLGHLYFDQGDAVAALTAYEQAQQRLPRSQQISTAIAALNVGYAQEATSACDKAISSFEAVRQSPVPWLHGEAYLGIGRCHEQNGATEKAIAIYDQALADTDVTETVKQTINDRLAQLRPPPPVASAPQALTEPATAAPASESPPTPEGQQAVPESQPAPPTTTDKPAAAR